MKKNNSTKPRTTRVRIHSHVTKLDNNVVINIANSARLCTTIVGKPSPSAPFQ